MIRLQSVAAGSARFRTRYVAEENTSGADHRREKGDSGRVRTARDRHRLPGGPGRAADEAHLGPDGALEGAQARPPLAARFAAAGRSPSPVARLPQES